MKKGCLMAVMFLLAATVGVILSYRSWIVYRDQRRQADAAIQDMKASETRQAELMRVEARLRSGAGKEELARKRRYVKAGEIPAP